MKLTDLFEAQYKQWKKGDVVLDRNGKVHIVDHQDDVKVFMKGQSSGHHHPNGLTHAADDIVDAAKAVGTVDELPGVYDKVKQFIHKPAKGENLYSIGEGGLKALLDRTKGQDKFALRVALKAIGVREPN